MQEASKRLANHSPKQAVLIYLYIHLNVLGHEQLHFLYIYIYIYTYVWIPAPTSWISFSKFILISVASPCLSSAHSFLLMRSGCADNVTAFCVHPPTTNSGELTMFGKKRTEHHPNLFLEEPELVLQGVWHDVGLDGNGSGRRHGTARHIRNVHGHTSFLIRIDGEKPARTASGACTDRPTKSRGGASRFLFFCPIEPTSSVTNISFYQALRCQPCLKIHK